MADNGQPAPEPAEPIRRCMQVGAHISSELAWFHFAIAAYAAAPTREAKVALREYARDLARTAKLATVASEGLIQWAEQKQRESQ